MQTDHKTLNKLFGLACFLFALILYTVTLAPVASFWDPGERIAVANSLQIPHPPGAPMYMLFGRLFAMFVPAEYVGFSVNFMSALSSAITIMLLYLIIVRLYRIMTGNPDSFDVTQRIAMYGGALIGALTFAATDSIWFVSVEAETYAMSLTFTALVFWMVLKWSEKADDPGNEKWLVGIAYLIGIALGIHLLNLLAIFAITLIIYFRKFEFKPQSFLAACGIGVLAFLAIFPITIIEIPKLSGYLGEATFGLIGPITFIILILALLSIGIYYTHQKQLKVANYVLVMYTAVMIGFSSYGIIYIRSAANPPIDQNNPDNVERFTSYMKREQYGSTPLLRDRSFDNALGDINRDEEKFFPRRHSSMPQHIQVYAQYSSDLDFFVRYQLGHMYFRYFNWNFIGRQADIQDTPSYFGSFQPIEEYADNHANNFYWYLPFLLGLLGAVYHFVRDWKRAFAVFALFVATGIAIAIFLNQTPFQPRERDYSYIGSFFAFSIWIGLGATALLEMLRSAVNNKIALLGALLAMYLLVPLRVLTENYFDHDRSKQYVAEDYGYNMLNSLEPYSIIFTNGDNDTFPLWYLQEVRGIRTDVRVVNLSLLNTPWYIDQVKNRWTYDSPPVKISYTDDEIRRIEEKFRFQRASDFHTPGTYRIPVDLERYERLINSERLPGTISIGEHIETGSIEWPDNLHAPEFSFHIPLEELEEEIVFDFSGQYLFNDGQRDYFYTRVQDDLVFDIIQNNIVERPIYFAITVSGDGQLNLMNHMRLEGKAFRVIPQYHEEEYGHLDTEIHGERLSNFMFRYLNDESVYFDQNIRRMFDNYRTIITRQANEYILKGDLEQARYWLTWGEENLPFTTITPDLTTVLTYSLRFAQSDAFDDALRLSEKFMDNFFAELGRASRGLDELETVLNRIEQELNDPANRSRVQRRMQLQTQRTNTENRLRSRFREYSSNLSRLIVLQRIYFMAGDVDAAMRITDRVNETVGTQTNFPRTEQENLDQFERIFI